ncbi:ABC transporter related protein [Pseudodesulfovibrio mercurii]|uniref:ABC transporter related protein n=1 Tax=Pseudodesulfovibrio mercurii TaxID=641491 RepID=F0JGQ3_9BACT|nr:energy-coupling factor ABC transporter ATP-binding protein [Pseudodesulfovibrio mercurii]EGB13922.1 ABC transporter related protein [Pseudodesulfovibrio mercurii]
MSALVVLDHIRQRYSDRTVLDIEHLEFAEGTISGLAGPNGSGKSTLLCLLALLEPPAQGTITFLGRPAHPGSAVTRQVSLLVQEPYLLKRTVFANVAYGLRIRGKNDIPAKVFRALEIVGLDPGVFARRQWFELSGGEVQRVALAARLVIKPKLLLMDEPTASLDAKSAELIHQAALSARDEYGASLVVASHDMPWLKTLADHIHYLDEGRLVRTVQHSEEP